MARGAQAPTWTCRGTFCWALSGIHPSVRLVACQVCHAHIDVTRERRARVHCACGATVANRPPEPLDLPIHRCAACGAGLAEAATTCGYCQAAVVRDPSRLGLVCPECFARTVEGGRFCVGCGIEIRPCMVRDVDEEQACPACGSPLRAVSLERIVVRECGACGGTWVRSTDFDAIVERLQGSTPRHASEGLGALQPPRAVTTTEVVYRRCPECRRVMHRRNFGRSSGVIVDWCRDHGTWFDPSELESVAAFVRAGGLDDRPRELPDVVAHTIHARPEPTFRGASLADLLLSILT